MRRICKTLVLVLALPCSGAQLAGAQPARHPGISVAAGVALPASPRSFRDQHGPGLAVSGGLRFASLPILGLALGFEVGYYRMSLDAAAFDRSVQQSFPNVHFSGDDLFVVPIALVAELPLISFGVTKPYVSAGVGMDHLGRTSLQLSGPNSNDSRLRAMFPGGSDNVLGVSAGFGVRTPLSPLVVLFADVAWHIAFTSVNRTQLVPLRLGIRF